MSDFLFQDQIDDLLRQQDFGSSDDGSSDQGTVEPESEVASGPDYTTLTDTFTLFSEQASTVLATLLSQEIVFTVTQCEELNKEILQNAVSDPSLLVTMSLKGPIEGELGVIIGTKEVAVLSDLMMMGDGSAEYTEDHKDAIQELFNQIMGSFTTALGERLGDSVSTGTLEVKEFDFANPAISFDESDMVIDNLNIPDITDSSIGIVLSKELSNQFMEKLKKDEGFGTSGEMDLSVPEMDDLGQVGDSFSDLEGGSDSGGEHVIADPSYQAPKENINMLLDVEMDVSIELGKADLSIKRILELAPGSIVELDRMAGEPVDLMVNNKVVAKGEVVVVDENFGIRIVSLVSPEERVKSLR